MQIVFMDQALQIALNHFHWKQINKCVGEVSIAPRKAGTWVMEGFPVQWYLCRGEWSPQGVLQKPRQSLHIFFSDRNAYSLASDMNKFYFYIYLLIAVMGVEPRTSLLLGKHWPLSHTSAVANLMLKLWAERAPPLPSSLYFQYLVSSCMCLRLSETFKCSHLISKLVIYAIFFLKST